MLFDKGPFHALHFTIAFDRWRKFIHFSAALNFFYYVYTTRYGNTYIYHFTSLEG